MRVVEGANPYRVSEKRSVAHGRSVAVTQASPSGRGGSRKADGEGAHDGFSLLRTACLRTDGAVAVIV